MPSETLEKETKEIPSELVSPQLLFELEKIKEGQLKISADLVAIKRFIKWRQIWFVIQVLMIAIPIILGVIFLPGYLKELLASLPDKLYY
jgi:hypothetical protein